MASAIQCLSNVPPLTALILSDDLHVNESAETSRTRGSVVRAWRELMARMWAPGGGGGAESPSELKRVIAKHARRFSGFDQEDAHELLVFLLDALIDDTNVRERKAKYRELAETAAQSDAAVAEEWWAYMGEHCASRVRDIFTGQHKTEVRCAVCGHVSRAFDTFTTLSLPVPRGFSALSLDDCLRKLTEPETLAGGDAAYCARCKTHQTSDKSFTLFRLPPLLVVHLKRFAAAGGGGYGGYGGRRASKIDAHVEFPRGGASGAPLDLRPYLPAGAPDGCAEYDCVAVCNHMGSINGGHYTADALNADTHAWAHFDDSRVSTTTARELSGSAAYMLLYLRRDVGR